LFFATLLQISAQTVLPTGFAEKQYATGLTNPTVMAFAPDACPASGTPVHRLFVCEQAGTVRVFRNGVLQPTPFLTVNADTRGERGLDGIVFDQNFAANGFVYIYYTIKPASQSTPTHNRVIRVQADPANPDVALLGSGKTILDLPDLAVGSYVHNGSAMHFGPDGKLYIAVGENGQGTPAQSLSTVLGKILRINPVPENPDGSNPESMFPTDNPFYNTATGLNRAIYCLGLRNPFTFAFQPGTGRLFIDDVGASTWEEINEGKSGRNYGWPTIEGPAQPPVNGFTNPIFAYHHFAFQGGTPLGCAITGGTFYNPPTACAGDPPFGFPSQYVGQYFFLDLCGDWIYTLDPNQIDPASPYGFHRATQFASNIHGAPTYLTVGPDRNLYYISRNDGAVYQIRYPASLAPSIGTQPADVLVGQGWPATFTVDASGSPPLSYRWQRNDVDIPGAANSPSYTLQNPTVAADNGATFRCIISNSFGSTQTREAVLSVTTKQPPVCTISSPAENTYYDAGDTITFQGSAVDGHDIVTGDPQDGTLGPNAFTWQILFEHHPLNNPNHHTHPFFPPTTGIASGTVTLTFPETDPDVWYRIFFTAQDSYGLSTTVFRDIFPRHVQLKVASTPASVPVLLNGSPETTPYPFWSVVNLMWNISVVTPQAVNGLVYDFLSWSDQGARSHNIFAPPTATSYVATFWKRPGYGSITANPNPVQVSDGSGKAVTTLFWSSRQTNEVEVRLGAPKGQLIARSGAGNFSQGTTKSISDGAKVFLQDVSNNQPLSSTYTLDVTTIHVANITEAASNTVPTGSITANPNPFIIDNTGLGQTTLSWTSNGTTTVQVHINAPNGAMFAGGDPGTFSLATGHWVTDGMTFYLQNVSNGLPLTAANTLATVRMRAVSPAPVGFLSANPNPFTPAANGLGQTTLTWTSAGTNRVELHVNAPDGKRVAASGSGTFSFSTGQWVRNGMTFYLQNVSNGFPLTSAGTLATVTVTAGQ
jgi:glucose/arabinose dehydrogenase